MQQQQRALEHALVTGSRSSGVVRPKGTSTAPTRSLATVAARDKIKSPPSSSNNNAAIERQERASATSVSGCSGVTSSRISSGSNATLTKKVDDLFKRMQPHTIVQTYEKLLGALKIAPSLVVNGETLMPLAAAPTSLSAGWKAATKAELEVLPGAFHPPSGQFHYARCLQYAPSDSRLSLATLKTLQVSFTSATNRSTATLVSSRLPATLTKKHWRLVAESSNKQLGLALYELSLGTWQHSSIVALVWSQTLEVVKLSLQLNVAESLYTSVQRPIRIPADDIDSQYGLHSYIVAVSIRTFDSVLWEKEFYGVEFAASAPQSLEAAQVVRAELLDSANNVYRDRERYLSSPDAALPVATDALSFAMDTTLLLDVGVWEGSTCAPIWGLSKALSILRPPAEGASRAVAASPDFSLSSKSNKQSLVLLHDDASRGNGLSIALEKLATSGATKTRVFVKQVEIALSLRFIDATFGTSYTAKR